MRYDSPYRSATVCTAVTGSMTMAMKAQRALSKNALMARAVKVSAASGESGCVYGIEFDCPLLGNVKSVLQTAGIEVREYLR